MAAVLIVILLLGQGAVAEENRIRLPDISRIDSHDISLAHEVVAGRTIYRELRKVLPVLDDPELMLWLRALGNRIVQYVPESRYPFYFSIIDDPNINAFATQGGVVAVNAGLILAVDSEDELAAVIAHEIAHVSQHHIQRMQARSAGDSLITGLGVLATIIAASYDPAVAQAALMSTFAFQGQQQLAFSRQMETEADRIGMKILTDAGYDPSAMATFLHKLERFNSGADDEIVAYLRTHPLTNERISNVTDLVRRLPKVRRSQNPGFLYAREKVRALTATNRSDYGIPRIEDEGVRKYAKAWALARRLQLPEAIEMLSGESSLQATISRARWLNEDRRHAETVRLISPLLGLYAQSEPIAMLMAEAYLGTGDGEKAWAVISRVPVIEQNSLGFFDLKARAADAAGRQVDGFRALAQKSLRLGHYTQARMLLKRALKLSHLSEVDKSRLTYEIDRLEKEQERETLAGK
jgi:predicted Zn-dependent protease